MVLEVFFFPSNIILFGVVVYLLRLIYRVTLHPLAKFPGPRLAALTNLYAINHDVNTKDSLVKHLKALHDKYGPIVRVRPDEIHIFDWEAYHTVFKHNSGFDRAPDLYDVPFIAGSLLTNLSTRGARPHRDLYVHSFSRASINELEPLIHDKLSTFFDRLQEAATQNKSVNLHLGFNCLTADVTMHYCYQMSFSFIEAKDFRAQLIVDFQEFAPAAPTFWYFPTMGKILNTIIFNVLPDNVVKAAIPGAAAMKGMMEKCASMIHSLSSAPPDSTEVQSSIFRTALNPNKEKGQYSASAHELSADSVLMFLAGTDTTANALLMGIWGLMRQPSLWQRLRSEVSEVIPNTSTLVPQRDLETLPLLRAVVKESLRFSMGTSARLGRLVPSSGATLCGKVIAPGSKVSFSHYVYNYDPAIFSDPFNFKPDRWMGSKEHTEYLDSHMVSFSRGSRNCLGMNLAYAELYSTFAHLVRRFDLINDGTTEHDMDWFDAFTPSFFGDLKVKLRAVEK